MKNIGSDEVPWTTHKNENFIILEFYLISLTNGVLWKLETKTSIEGE